MLRIQPLSSHQAALLAVEALDHLVTDLVIASRLKVPADFLDWVADEATPLVELQVSESFGQKGFAASLHVGDPRIALAGWVRHWVGPWIAARFEPLAALMPAQGRSFTG